MMWKSSTTAHIDRIPDLGARICACVGPHVCTNVCTHVLYTGARCCTNSHYINIYCNSQTFFTSNAPQRSHACYRKVRCRHLWKYCCVSVCIREEHVQGSNAEKHRAANLVSCPPYPVLVSTPGKPEANLDDLFSIFNRSHCHFYRVTK